MNARDEFKVDKTAFSVATLEDADDDLEYWLSRTPQERVRAVELTRQALYGYEPAAARLQRVFTVSEREQG